MQTAELIATLLAIYFFGGLMFMFITMMIDITWSSRYVDEMRMWSKVIFWPITLLCYIILGLIIMFKFLLTRAPKEFYGFLKEDFFYKIFPKKENIEDAE